MRGRGRGVTGVTSVMGVRHKPIRGFQGLVRIGGIVPFCTSLNTAEEGEVVLDLLIRPFYNRAGDIVQQGAERWSGMGVVQKKVYSQVRF